MRRGGFTLMEVLVVLGLTSVVLYSVALLTQQTVGTLNFLRTKSESTLSATLACERLGSELREAVQLASGGGANFSFRKVRPSEPPVVGNEQPPLPPPAPPPLVPPTPSHQWVRAYSGGQLFEVNYRFVNPVVERRADGGPFLTVANNVNGFSVNPVAGRDRTFQIDLTVVEKKRLKRYINVVYCPGLP